MFTQAVYSTSPMQMTNEALYDALTTQTAPLDAGLELLVQRLKPIIINIGRGYLRILHWDLNDAFQEARILLWELVGKRRYKPGTPFHSFFSKCFHNRLNKIYRDYLLKNPTHAGSLKVEYCAHQGIMVDVIAFKEDYIEKYKAAQSERNKRLYDKKLAAEGRTRQPILTEEEREVRKEAARKRAIERAATWQQENREAYNRRRAEIRRQKKEGTFVDKRKKVKTGC